MMALLALSLSGGAWAAALGLPESTARIGYAAGVSRLTVDDPAGPAETAINAQPLTLIYTDLLSGKLRYWVEGYYFPTTLDASTTDIGQDISRIGAQLALQRNVQWRQWSPWLGLGIDVSRNSFTHRHTADSDGFLLNSYADRSATAFGISAHLVNEWALTRDWDISAKLGQVFAVSGGMNETSLSVGVLYRY